MRDCLMHHAEKNGLAVQSTAARGCDMLQRKYVYSRRESPSRPKEAKGNRGLQSFSLPVVCAFERRRADSGPVPEMVWVGLGYAAGPLVTSRWPAARTLEKTTVGADGVAVPGLLPARPACPALPCQFRAAAA